MKCKLLIFLLVCCFLFSGNVQAQWSKDPGFDSLYVDEGFDAVQTNQAAIDLVLSRYRKGCLLLYNSTTKFDCGVGEIVLSNSDGSVRLFTKNTSAITTTPSISASTTYYVYAKASSASATTFTIEVSTSATTPTATYYKRLGSFYSNADSEVTKIVNDTDEQITQATGSFDISSTGEISVTDIGFKPTTVLMLVQNSRDGESGGFDMASGWSIVTNDNVFSICRSTDNANGHGSYSTTKIELRAQNGSNLNFVATLTSLDSTGFTINVTTYTWATKIFYIAFK